MKIAQHLKLYFIKIEYATLVPSSRRTQCHFVIMVQWLLLFGKMVAVDCEIQTQTPEIHKSSISVISTAKNWHSGVGSRVLSLLAHTPCRKRRYSPYCDLQALCRNVTELVWTRIASSLLYGSNRTGQHFIHKGLSVFCYIYIHSTFFLVSVTFHGLLVLVCDYFWWVYLISKVFFS